MVSTFQSVHRISLDLNILSVFIKHLYILRNVFLLHQFYLLAQFLIYFIQINIFSNFVYFRVLNLGSMDCLGVFWHTGVLKGCGPRGPEQSCVDTCMSELFWVCSILLILEGLCGPKIVKNTHLPDLIVI